MTGATRGTLLHLANTGSLTIGEIAEHFDRAQSVVSEIVDGLEKKGLLERMRDPKDKRRALVWLTDAGQAALVFSTDLVAKAMRRMRLAAWKEHPCVKSAKL